MSFHSCFLVSVFLQKMGVEQNVSFNVIKVKLKIRRKKTERVCKKKTLELPTHSSDFSRTKASLLTYWLHKQNGISVCVCFLLISISLLRARQSGNARRTNC